MASDEKIDVNDNDQFQIQDVHDFTNETVQLNLYEVRHSYNSVDHYIKTYQQGILNEKLHDQGIKTNIMHEDIDVTFNIDSLTVRFEIMFTRNVINVFDIFRVCMHELDNARLVIMVKTVDVLEEQNAEEPVRLIIGRIVRKSFYDFENFDKVRRIADDRGDTEIKFLCSLHALQNPIPFTRCLTGLDALKRAEENQKPLRIPPGQRCRHSQLSPQFINVLVGITPPNALAAPRRTGSTGFRIPPHLVSNLNEIQRRAVELGLSERLSVCQGPPGTGKTTTLVALVQVALHNKKRVLLCAPSNAACNNLLQKLVDNNVAVLRFCSLVDEDAQVPEHLRGHSILAKIETNPELMNDLEKYRMLSNIQAGRRDENEDRKLADLAYTFAKNVCEKYDVIISTSCGCGNLIMKFQHFNLVLVDEAGQDVEPMTLLPILCAGLDYNIMLVGDHKQLGPVVQSGASKCMNYGLSMMERLIKIGVSSVMLLRQYRMHPALTVCPNEFFYSRKLLDGVSHAERVDIAFDTFWVDRRIPTLFVCCRGQEGLLNSSTFNIDEIQLIGRLIKHLQTKCEVSRRLVILTPYRAQAKMLSNRHLTIRVSTVYAFQGQEADYVILSLTKSNSQNDIGFMVDPRLINVAITRSRFGLIIVGNARTFSNHPIWLRLLESYAERKVLVELEENSMRFRQAKFRGDEYLPSSDNYNFNVIIPTRHMPNEPLCWTISAPVRVFGAVDTNTDVAEQVLQQFNVQFIADVPEQHEAGPFICRFISNNEQDLQRAASFVQEILRSENDAYEEMKKRCIEKRHCGKIHDRPGIKDFENDEVFTEVQRRATFWEFGVRHDLASCLLGQGASFIKTMLEENDTVLRLGKQRELRSVVIMKPARGTLEKAGQIVKERIQEQLLLHDKFNDAQDLYHTIRQPYQYEIFGVFQQASQGDYAKKFHTPPTSPGDIEWARHRGMGQNDAMNEYVRLVGQLAQQMPL